MAKCKPYLVYGVGADGQGRAFRFATKASATKKLRAIRKQIEDIPPQFGAYVEMKHRPCRRFR